MSDALFISIHSELEQILEGQNRNEEHFRVAIDLLKQMADDIGDLKEGILHDHET